MPARAWLGFIALSLALGTVSMQAQAQARPKHKFSRLHQPVRTRPPKHNEPPPSPRYEHGKHTARVEVPAGPLPEPVMAALARAHVPLSAISVVVEPFRDNAPILSLNAAQPMAPASTMKLITTYAGLSMLGPDFRWRTSAFADGPVTNGVLNGNLYIEGTGDPKLVPEELIDLVQRIHAAGITAIHGNLVLDKRYFAPSTRDAPPFDSEVDAPYNVGPDPLLYAFKSLLFTVDPQSDGHANIDVVPPLEQLHIVNDIHVTAGACRNASAASPRFQTQADGELDAVFAGPLSRRCGERSTQIASSLDHSDFFSGGFLALWQQTGGTFDGHVLEAPVPANARLVASHQSPVLSDIVRDINKLSNNTMARNLFLTLGAVGGKPPSDYAEAGDVVQRWLARMNISTPGLTLDNGSGLSHNGRVSAQGLAALLQSAMNSPVAQAFSDSLPIVGVDGTMRHRLRGSPILGNARIKTGTLNDVRAIAGYVAAQNGDTYIVVSLINDPRAEAARAVHDALLQWVYGLPGETPSAATPAALLSKAVPADLQSKAAAARDKRSLTAAHSGDDGKASNRMRETPIASSERNSV